MDIDMDANKEFGAPVTDETLKAMPKYAGKEITSLDRACEALAMINSEDKETNALRQVEETKGKWVKGAITTGMAYNATGNTIFAANHHNWEGYLVVFPKSIVNGGWGIFAQPSLTGHNSGALVYRCKNLIKSDWLSDWMFSWTSNKKAYTEIREAGHTWDWKKVKHLTDIAGDKWTCAAHGLRAEVSIRGYKNETVYTAVIKPIIN